jgi:hypothetical protein
MNPSSDFYEKNKVALIEEIGSTILESNKILNEIINNCEDDEKEPKPSDDKLLIALGYKLGYLSAVYNQLYVFENGVLKDHEQKKIGFNSIFNKKND